MSERWSWGQERVLKHVGCLENLKNLPCSGDVPAMQELTTRLSPSLLHAAGPVPAASPPGSIALRS